MKQQTIGRNEMQLMLKKAFPKMWMKNSEDFSSDYNDNAIWTGEGSEGNDGLPLFDYYAEDPKEHVYVMGVRKTLHDLLNKHGWYAECYDPGTYFLQPD